jgi:hypothetical protein
MFAVFKREFRSYFTSLWGYIFIAAFIALGAVSYITINLSSAMASMSYYFQSMITLVMFVLPILTMRIFSEDMKQKTDQLLYTAPVSSLSIVLGKFLAVYSVFLIGLLITAWFPISLSFFGKVPVAETISMFVGFALFCGSIIAIGVFMSSLTESQVIAAIATYAFVIGTIMLSSMLLPKVTNNVLSDVIGWFSLTNKFSDFLIGVLSLAPILYYISFMVIFVFLANMTLQKRRFS